MRVPIKQIILEDFDLDQSYISPIVQNAQDYNNSINSYNQTQNAYNDLLHRGITSDEKREMLKGIQNLTGNTIRLPFFQGFIPDSDVINKYRMEQTNDMFMDEAKKNYENGKTFRERESDLRRDLINKNSEINHLNNKLNSAERYTDHVRSIGDTKARLYGAGGLIGGGVIGGVLGGVHMANKLKNDENKPIKH